VQGSGIDCGEREGKGGWREQLRCGGGWEREVQMPMPMPVGSQERMKRLGLEIEGWFAGKILYGGGGGAG